jgi:N-acetylmuramic acid 6-phosphate etherase
MPVMSDRPIERAHAASDDLGRGSVRDDVALVLGAHGGVLPAMAAVQDSLAAAVDLIVSAMSDGGRLVYAGAGTSGWLAALDAAEVVVTFGMGDRVASITAGGRTLDPVAMTLGDDDVESLAHEPVLAAMQPGDAMLAVSASGRTPFTVAAARQALVAGARLIVVVNAEDSPLEQWADVAIVVPTSGEVVPGSTRLSAGLAQKLVLNTLSTVSMLRLGRAYRNRMVCVEPLNDKLRTRIAVAVAEAAGVELATARAALQEAGRGDVATVSLVADVDVVEAALRLDRYRGSIDRAIADR